MIDVFAVANYRSLRDVVVPLRTLNLITGANGTGKSSLYRALRLLVEIAGDRAIGSLASEGGLPSVMWAGPESISRRMRRGDVPVQGSVRKGPAALRVGFAGEELGYSAELGLPPPEQPPSPRPNLFWLDPHVKRESIWSGSQWSRRAALVERRRSLVEARDGDGHWRVAEQDLATHESMLTWIGDPRISPEIVITRHRIQAWRFYDQFRSDADAPARVPAIGTRTMVLGHEARDLAAALETILEIGDEQALAASVDEAFRGARLDVENIDGRFHVRFHERGLLRPLGQAELSDGTLRYLMWLAALHTPRPPELMVLNEPETSLHEDLLQPLARTILHAAKRSQLIVVSHAATLVRAMQASADCNAIVLEKELGETRLRTDLDAPSWSWPPR